MDPSKQKIDVYEIITNRIIELLEQGVIPWQKPWSSAGMPMNLISRRTYRGINLWLLLSLNYTRNFFLTWDQLKKIGGSVIAGERGHVVVFWKTPKQEDTDETHKVVPLLRYYKVFNIDQCRNLPEGLAPIVERKEIEPLFECEEIISKMPQAPEIKFEVQQAFYDASKDYINMPKRKTFSSMETYYATLFHELVHSTGHEKRLNRKSITEMAEFGTELYSIEELVAEIGSAYLCSFTNIFAPHNSAAYIGGWLGKLRNDKRFIVRASGHSQRAVDFIINQPRASDASEELEHPEGITESYT